MKHTTLASLKQDLLLTFAPLYQMCDPAHREDHFEEVYQTGLHLNKVLCSEFDPKLILMFAYLHDMFTWSRANHQELSYSFVIGTDCRVIVDNLTKEERVLVANACLTHRASYKGKFLNCFSELMSSADRCMPGTAKDLVKRSYLYMLDKNSELSDKENLKRAIAHIKEKYSEEGYARYPVVYRSVFQRKINSRHAEIQVLNADTFKF